MEKDVPNNLSKTSEPQGLEIESTQSKLRDFIDSIKTQSYIIADKILPYSSNPELLQKVSEFLANPDKGWSDLAEIGWEIIKSYKEREEIKKQAEEQSAELPTLTTEKESQIVYKDESTVWSVSFNPDGTQHHTFASIEHNIRVSYDVDELGKSFKTHLVDQNDKEKVNLGELDNQELGGITIGEIPDQAIESFQNQEENTNTFQPKEELPDWATKESSQPIEENIDTFRPKELPSWAIEDIKNVQENLKKRGFSEQDEKYIEEMAKLEKTHEAMLTILQEKENSLEVSQEKDNSLRM